MTCTVPRSVAPLLRNRTPFVGTIGYMGGVPALMSEWVWSWTQMLAFNSEHFGSGAVHYEKAAQSFHSSARNELAAKMKGDWLLQMDTDHEFDPDICARLVETFEQHNLDVLCGLYYMRQWPHLPVIFKYFDDILTPEGEPLSRPIVAWTGDTPIIQVSGTGGGCLLVRRRVFDRIRRELKCEPFDIRHPWSEDHSFFMRLHSLEIPVYCDTRVQCYHLTTKRVTGNDFVRDALSGVPQSHEFKPVEA